MPQLRAFAICPSCSELYPSFRGCPSCDGDAPVAATPSERAAPVAEVPAAEAVAHPQRASLAPYVAALSVGVVLACGVLMALIAT